MTNTEEHIHSLLKKSFNVISTYKDTEWYNEKYGRYQTIFEGHDINIQTPPLVPIWNPDQLDTTQLSVLSLNIDANSSFFGSDTSFTDLHTVFDGTVFFTKDAEKLPGAYLDNSETVVLFVRVKLDKFDIAGIDPSANVYTKYLADTSLNSLLSNSFQFNYNTQFDISSSQSTTISVFKPYAYTLEYLASDGTSDFPVVVTNDIGNWSFDFKSGIITFSNDPKDDDSTIDLDNGDLYFTFVKYVGARGLDKLIEVRENFDKDTAAPGYDNQIIVDTDNNGVFLYKPGSDGGWTSVGGKFDVSDTDIFYTDGNVGIGTSSPSTNLDVSGSVNVSVSLTVDGSLNVGTMNDVEGKINELEVIATHITSGNTITMFANDVSVNGGLTVGGSTKILNSFVIEQNGVLDSDEPQLLVKPYSNTANDAEIRIQGARDKNDTSILSSLTFSNYDNDYNSGAGIERFLCRIGGRVSSKDDNLGGFVICNFPNGITQTQALTMSKNGNFKIGDSVTFQDNDTYKLEVVGNTRIAQELDVSGDLTIDGSLNIGGNVVCKSLQSFGATVDTDIKNRLSQVFSTSNGYNVLDRNIELGRSSNQVNYRNYYIGLLGDGSSNNNVFCIAAHGGGAPDPDPIFAINQAGYAEIAGNCTIGSDLTVGGSANISSDFTIDGSLNVGTMTDVKGKINHLEDHDLVVDASVNQLEEKTAHITSGNTITMFANDVSVNGDFTIDGSLNVGTMNDVEGKINHLEDHDLVVDASVNQLEEKTADITYGDTITMFANDVSVNGGLTVARNLDVVGQFSINANNNTVNTVSNSFSHKLYIVNYTELIDENGENATSFNHPSWVIAPGYVDKTYAATADYDTSVNVHETTRLFIGGWDDGVDGHDIQTNLLGFVAQKHSFRSDKNTVLEITSTKFDLNIPAEISSDLTVVGKISGNSYIANAKPCIVRATVASGDITLTGDGVIKWDRQTTASTGYNSSTGVFTAPVKGIYSFSIHVIFRSNNPVPAVDDFEIRGRLNGASYLENKIKVNPAIHVNSSTSPTYIYNVDWTFFLDLDLNDTFDFITAGIGANTNQYIENLSQLNIVLLHQIS